MGGERRADAARTVRRRRDERRPRRLDERPGDRMARRAQGHAVKASARQLADAAVLCDRRDEGERPRPEGLRQRQRICVERRLARRGGKIQDVGDQRVEDRRSLAA